MNLHYNQACITLRKGDMMGNWFGLGQPKNLCQSRKLAQLMVSCLLGWGVAIAPLQSAHSAEKVSVPIGPLEFSLTVDSLATFAETGEITPDFRFYARLLKPAMQTKLREVLQKRFKANAFAISQYTYTPLGEKALTNLGAAVQTEAGVNGFHAIRAAVILAAAKNPDGFTIVDVLRAYPTRGIRIDGNLLLNLGKQLTIYFSYLDAATQAVDQQMATEAAAQPALDASQLPDLSKPGSFSVEKRSLDFTVLRQPPSISNEKIDQPFEVDVYLPQGASEPLPIVMVSHGLGSDRARIAWLLEHVASHGFVVVAPEHRSSNLARRQELLQGFFQSDIPAAAYVDRPIDIQVALTGLEQLAQTDASLKGKLDFQRVGMMGNSLGGLTALAVAGAEINFARLQQTCNNAPTLNFSIFLQCIAKALPAKDYGTHDRRIKAVVSIHPPSSVIFGPEGIAKIQIPTLLMSGTADILAPATSEQIYPFTWLKTPEKYLALMVPSGHIFAEAKDNLAPKVSLLLGGPNPELKQAMVKTLSVAFMQAYLNDRPAYRQYLSAAYAKYLSKSDLRLDMVRSLTEAQIEQAYGEPPPLPIVPPLAGSSPK